MAILPRIPACPGGLPGQGGRSWDVESEDLLSPALVGAFVRQHPEAVKERLQRGEVVKIVIDGKPVERDGQTFDHKMRLAEYARRHAALDDLAPLVDLRKKARKCMGVESVPAVARAGDV